MEYALQKLPALVNDLSLSIRNPILVYSFFALYGLMMLVLVTYVHIKFRTAAKTLKLLQTEWKSAESQQQQNHDAEAQYENSPCVHDMTLTVHRHRISKKCLQS